MNVIVVVEVQLVAPLVEKAQCGVQTGSRAAAQYIEDQHLALVSVKAVDIEVRTSDFSIHHRGELDALGALNVIVGL